MRKFAMNIENIFLKHGYKKTSYRKGTPLQKNFADTCAIVFVEGDNCLNRFHVYKMRIILLLL